MLQPNPRARPLRVAERLRRELAAIFALKPFRDPLLASVRLTINQVQLSADLKQAKIFLAPPQSAPTNSHQAILAGLARANGFLRGQLARRAEFRFVPDLRFYIDPAALHHAAIESALAGVAR